MWKVATALGPSGMTTAAQAATPAAEKILPYARWGTLGTSVAFLILGGLAIGIDFTIGSIIVGAICIGFGTFVAIMEYPFVPLAKFEVFHFFCNYYYKAALFLGFCIPPFFNTFTILCGIASICCAAVWAFCGFKGAKGTPVTAQPTEQQLREAEEARANDPHAQQQHQQQQQQDKRKSWFGFGDNEPEPAPVIPEEAPHGKKPSKKSKFSLASQGAHPGKG